MGCEHTNCPSFCFLVCVWVSLFSGRQRHTRKKKTLNQKNDIARLNPIQRVSVPWILLMTGRWCEIDG